MAVPPIAPARGLGRRHVLPHDTLTSLGTPPADAYWKPGGRKHFVAADSVNRLLGPATDDEIARDEFIADAPARIRDALREWLRVQNIKVDDEPLFASCEIAPSGTFWIMSACSRRGEVIARDGASAKVLAEKLSGLPIMELRCFGLRHRHWDEPESPPHNRSRTFKSHGVADAVRDIDFHGGEAPVVDSTLNWDVGNPVRQRFDVQDHLVGGLGEIQPCTELGGKPGERALQGGIERGIGHGRRKVHGSVQYDHLDAGDVGNARRTEPGGDDHNKDEDCAGAGLEMQIGKGKRRFPQDGAVGVPIF